MKNSELQFDRSCHVLIFKAMRKRDQKETRAALSENVAQGDPDEDPVAIYSVSERMAHRSRRQENFPNERGGTYGSLEKEDVSDVVFDVVRCSQLDALLPRLAENKSKTIVSVKNNMRAAAYGAMEDKSVLFAFFSAAGQRNDSRIESICMKKITIGRINALFSALYPCSA